MMPADMRAHNEQLIQEFRANGGPTDGRPLLLLTTVGRRSGQRRTTPMMHLQIDGRDLVIASNNGASRDPDWFHNLVAEPHVMVETAGEAYPARAVVATGELRDRLWSEVVATYPFFGEHQSRLTRKIPVVVLERGPAG